MTEIAFSHRTITFAFESGRLATPKPAPFIPPSPPLLGELVNQTGARGRPRAIEHRTGRTDLSGSQSGTTTKSEPDWHSFVRLRLTAATVFVTQPPSFLNSSFILAVRSTEGIDRAQIIASNPMIRKGPGANCKIGKTDLQARTATVTGHRSMSGARSC